MKTLIYDIETVQNTLGDAWKTMGAAYSFINCFAYKWEGQQTVHRIDLNTTGTLDRLSPFNEKSDEKIVKEAHKIMSQAECTVAHYGNGFDWKYMNAKFDYYGLEPLSHIPRRDTCFKAKSTYKMGGNSLRTLAKYFGVTQKSTIEFGHWLNLYCHNRASMREIGVYCEYDVKALSDIYDKMKHHFTPIQHNGLIKGNSLISCPECASINVIRRQGFVTSTGCHKVRMSCNDCRRWFTVLESKLGGSTHGAKTR